LGSIIYIGSTKYLNKRIQQHQKGEGANFTKKHQPLKLVYYEEFPNVAEAFYREKQIQNWSHKKKSALINGNLGELKKSAECCNDSHCRNYDHLDSARWSFWLRSM